MFKRNKVIERRNGLDVRLEGGDSRVGVFVARAGTRAGLGLARWALRRLSPENPCRIFLHSSIDKLDGPASRILGVEARPTIRLEDALARYHEQQDEGAWLN